MGSGGYRAVLASKVGRIGPGFGHRKARHDTEPGGLSASGKGVTAVPETLMAPAVETGAEADCSAALQKSFPH